MVRIMDAVRADFSSDQIEIRDDRDETVDVFLKRLVSVYGETSYAGGCDSGVSREPRNDSGRTGAAAGKADQCAGEGAATAEAIADVLDISAGRTLEPEGEWWKS